MKNTKMLMLITFVGCFTGLNASNVFEGKSLQTIGAEFEDNVKRMDYQYGRAEFAAAFNTVAFPIVSIYGHITNQQPFPSVLSWSDLNNARSCNNGITWFAVRYSHAQNDEDRDKIVRGFQAKWDKCQAQIKSMQEKIAQSKE